MLSYTGRRTLFGQLANNTASATLTVADSLMNESERRLISMRDWDFLERQYTLTTTASTVTVTIASPAVFSLTAHNFAPDTVVYFSTTGALPTGLASGTAYYVLAAGLTANAFEVSTTIGGTAVNTSGTQSGTHTVTTSIYILPAYTRRPESVYVTVGAYRYTPKEVTTRQEWDRLNQVVITGDIARFYYIYDGFLELYPKPASASNVVTINARRIFRDLSVADYTTGNVDIITNGSTSVTGAGTPNWTSPMVGRFIKITPGNTATSSGDGIWYEISQVTSSTALVLKRAYGGTSLTTGATAAYTIGEMGLLPEPHQTLPVYEALKIYFTSVEPNAQKAQLYKQLSDESQAQLFKDYASKMNVVVDNGWIRNEYEQLNPNLHITL